MKKAQTARPTATRAAAPKAAACPTIEATPPSTGPKSAPTIAAAIASPIVWPRRSAGVAPTSHVRPAVHANALPKPCAKRARSRTRIESAVAKIIVVSAITSTPAIVVGRAPKRAVARPPGIPPSEGADRVGPCEDAHSRLREVVVLGVVGQQRRQRDEEHRVDEDDSADEEEQTAHAVSRSSRASAARGTRAGRPGPRRSSASAQRARRGRVRRPAPAGRGAWPHARRRGPEVRSSATTASTSWPISLTRPMRSATSGPNRSPVRK